MNKLELSAQFNCWHNSDKFLITPVAFFQLSTCIAKVSDIDFRIFKPLNFENDRSLCRLFNKGRWLCTSNVVLELIFL